ncbi:Osmosensitive K+ channel histidine kinase KdpD [Perkinsela sp. CCAP 1560/4]|nr:Osmosensitive K+ channel histidine kinase KdpD [Perkinsela sp. CCAP 1560/4]|eukprot:KNH06193.1 Osmosensitive K+ channel histidine kinase KdpD [Perkinsela sp. CCAP 1560/4]
MKRPNRATKHVLSGGIHFNHAEESDIHKLESRCKQIQRVSKPGDSFNPHTFSNPISVVSYPCLMGLWKSACQKQSDEQKGENVLSIPAPPLKKIIFSSTMIPHACSILRDITKTLDHVTSGRCGARFTGKAEGSICYQKSGSECESHCMLISDEHCSLLFKQAVQRLSFLKPIGYVRNMYSLDDEEVRSCHKLWVNFLSHAVISSPIDVKDSSQVISPGKYFAVGKKTLEQAIMMCKLINYTPAAIEILQMYPKVQNIDVENRKEGLALVNSVLQCYSRLSFHDVPSDRRLLENTLHVDSSDFCSFTEALYKKYTNLYGPEYGITVNYVATISNLNELTLVYQSLIKRSYIGTKLAHAFLLACARLPERGISASRSMAYSVYKITAACQPVYYRGTAPVEMIEALSMVTAAHGLPMETLLSGLHAKQFYGQKKLRKLQLFYLWSLVASGEIFLAIKRCAHLLSRRRITDSSILWAILSECSWELALTLHNLLQKYTYYRSERLFAMVLFRCKKNPPVVLRLLQRRMLQDSEDINGKPRALIKHGLDGNIAELSYRSGSTSPYVLGVVYNCILHDLDTSSRCFHSLSHTLSTIVFRSLGISGVHFEQKDTSRVEVDFGQYKKIIVPSPMLSAQWLWQWLFSEDIEKGFEGFQCMINAIENSITALSKRAGIVLLPFETLFCIFVAQQAHRYPHHILMSWVRTLQVNSTLLHAVPLHYQPFVIQYLQQNYDCYKRTNRSGWYQEWVRKDCALESEENSLIEKSPTSNMAKSFYDYDLWKTNFEEYFDPFLLTQKDIYPAMDLQGKCNTSNKLLQIEDRVRRVSLETILEGKSLVYTSFVLAREYILRLSQIKPREKEGISPSYFFSDPIKETARMMAQVRIFKRDHKNIDRSQEAA